MFWAKWSDDSAVTLYSLAHLAMGIGYQIVFHGVCGLSSWVAAVVALALHTVYEVKDYYLSYVVYENDPARMWAARNVVRQWGILADLLPPNSLANSVGDTIFFALGLLVGYYLRHRVTKRAATWVAVLIGVHLASIACIYALMYHKRLLRHDHVFEITRESRRAKAAKQEVRAHKEWGKEGSTEPVT